MEFKEQLDEIQKLVKELREKNEAMEKGVMSKADFKTFQEKVSDDFIALKTEMARPANAVHANAIDGKESKDGKAEYKKAFLNWARTGRMELNEKAAAYVRERKALVSDTTGQILITEEVESEIYRALPQLNVIRQYALVRTINTDRIRRRSLTEVTVGWGKLEIGGTPVETDVTPTEAYSYVEDLEGLTKIGKDELMDNDAGLESILADSFARAQADAEEEAFVNGTGHTFEQPEGILLAASGVTCIASAASGAVTFDDILNLMYGTPAQYRRSGTFIMHSGTELLLALLRETATGGYGAYLWQPSPAIGQPSTIYGRPVINCDTMPQVGDGTLQKVVIYGDLRAGYRIIDRMGMTVQRLVELYSLQGLIGLLVSKRTSGSVIRANALRILQEHA